MIEKTKRFLDLYDTKPLLLMLGVFYFLSLTSGSINGIWENIGSLVFCTAIVFSLNNQVIYENWTWLKTGLKTDVPDSRLTKAGRELKQARLGNSNKLFIPMEVGYFYQDDNFGMEVKHNIIDMTDTIDLLHQIKAKIDPTVVNSKKAHDIIKNNKEKV